MDEPVVVHCYTTRADVQDSANLAALGAFCRKMGGEARQGEIGLVVGTSTSLSGITERSRR